LHVGGREWLWQRVSTEVLLQKQNISIQAQIICLFLSKSTFINVLRFKSTRCIVAKKWLALHNGRTIKRVTLPEKNIICRVSVHFIETAGKGLNTGEKSSNKV
jgi:hypothetical protein